MITGEISDLTSALCERRGNWGMLLLLRPPRRTESCWGGRGYYQAASEAPGPGPGARTLGFIIIANFRRHSVEQRPAREN